MEDQQGGIWAERRRTSPFSPTKFNMNHDDDDTVDTTQSRSTAYIFHHISGHKNIYTSRWLKNKKESTGTEFRQYLLIGTPSSSWLIGVGQANLITLERNKSIIKSDEERSVLLMKSRFRI